MFDSDENYVEIGTALEPLEEEEVPKKKPVNISDQIVVDENGRRRFHGAFTGGFSAGYYNTVGSKEGWEPATFKSTRSDRFSRKNQNIHDFMDDEDLGAFGIAPQILHTTGDFDKKETRKRAKATPSDGPIPGEPVLDMIIKPVRDTVGMRILQRMGWRPGQGVGPRTYKDKPEKSKSNRKEKNSDPNRDDSNTFLEDATVESVDITSKVYGCPLPPGAIPRGSIDDEESSDSEIEDLDANVLFAPEDLDSPLCNPKENTYGLGYKGLDRNALTAGHGQIDLFGGSELKFRVENKKLNIRGEAFGVGAFEDDDEEVYSREDVSQYDFALETLEERKSRLANEKMMKKSKAKADGSIPGFIKAKHPPTRKKYFPPPTLPKDFEPVFQPKRKSRFEPAKPSSDTKDDLIKDARKQGLDRHKLTVEERQVLLGEAQERISIGQLDNEEDKELTRTSELQKAQEKAERLKKFAEVLQAYSSNKVTQVDSLGRPAFKPFMKNPEKQDRYEKYMTLAAVGYKECLHDLQPPDMTEWQREREKMEFERASALYKPISEVMSSRFVSAQSHDISHVVPIKEEAKVKDPTQDPKVAAKMNLFGKLTHQVLEWHPDRLFCKRLNVPHPYPDSKMVGVRVVASTIPSSASVVPKAVTQENVPPAEAPVAASLVPVPAVKKSLFDNLDFSKPPPGLLPPSASQTDSNEEPAPPGTEDELPIPVPSAGLDAIPSSSTSLPDTSEPPPIIKPPVDLFKEIFADTSSESEDETSTKKTTTAPTRDPKRDNINIPSAPKSNYVKRFDQTTLRTNRSTEGNETSSQIKALRDQKDFSNSTELSLKSKESQKASTEIKDKRAENKNADSGSEDDEEIYGPKPPTSLSLTQTQAVPAQAQVPFGQSSFSNPLMRIGAGVGFPENKFGHEDEEVEWVEKGKDSFSSSKKSSRRRSKSKSSTSVASHHHHRHSHHHKSKKSKEKHKSKHKSKKEGRKSSSKHKKSHKKKSESESRRKKDSEDSGDEENTDTDASSSSSPVQIHQSLTNKALLSKLKELTRSN